MTPVIDVAIEAADWVSLDTPSQLAEAAILAAIGETGISLEANVEISVLFCDDAFIRGLNRQWRGTDKPTNVLAFPTSNDPRESPLLGDIVIAFETASREALDARKPLRDHVAHLLVHGFLHLIGHDHVGAAEAATMEALECTILGRLGIANPYHKSLIEEAAGAND
jgi:probable rRNA maturation factor